MGAAIIAAACLTTIGSYQKLRDLDRSDSALYAYGGFLIEQGGRLYRDIWDHKPPGVYSVDALAFRLAGGASWSAAVAADTLATLAAIAACAAVAWQITSRLAAVSIAAVTAAFYLNHAAFHEGGGLAEIYMVACLAWAGWAFVTAGAQWHGGRSHRRCRAGLLVLSGVLVGAAVLFKPTALTTAAACMVTLAVESLYRGGLGYLVRSVAVFAAGLAAPPAAVTLVFWRQGLLGEMVDASLLYNLSYVERGAALSKLWTFHVHHNVYLLAAVTVILGAVLLRWLEPGRGAAPLRRATWRIFLPVWFLLEWAGIYAGNYDNGQYLFGCVIPLSCMVGIAGDFLLQQIRLAGEPWRRATAAACLTLGLSSAWWPASDQWRRTAALARGQTSDLAMDQVRAAGRVLAGSDPSDRIWVWGYAPQVYLRAQRQPATRFVFDGAFLNSRRIMREQFREMLADLDRRQPAYIVDAATTGWFGVRLRGPLPQKLGSQADAYRAELECLQAWVAEHYEAIEICGELVVYRRRLLDPYSQPGHAQPVQPWPQDGPDSATGLGW